MSRDPPLGVVGVGASAGGLGALTHFVSALRRTGLAYVVLQHQAKTQLGKLAPMLAGISPIPVVDAEHGAPLEPDHVYIVPPHTRASLAAGALVLEGPQDASPSLPIDGMFRSLVESLGANAIAIVLSGTGHDGTEGLRAVKLAGGITVAQEPSTAEFDEMPRSAIAAGVASVVLVPDRIGDHIAALRQASLEPALAKILGQLRELAGIDFSTYKRSTIERRLERQMARHRHATLAEYAAYLETHAAEARALYEDLLVHVTEFFRDRNVFDRVVAVLPDLLDAKPDGVPLRAWVPGCSTGEEVYSLAILFLEALAQRGDSRTVQLFGTDLSERAIEVARAARYPAAIGEQVSAQRLERYFVRDGPDWRVATHVRERCVFVRHDLATDPPFSRLDLVSCRNVLIYLGASLQARIIPLFHYALEQPGYLLLGTSETIAAHEPLFAQVEPGIPLYRRRPSPSRASLVFGMRPAQARRPDAPPSPDLFREADHVLLARYAPASVLVDEHFDIVQFRGRTGAFLEPAPGYPQLNVFKMARDGLGSELRSVALRAQRDGLPVRSEDVPVADGRRVDVEVIPLRGGSASNHYLIVFEERTSSTVRVPDKLPTRHGTADRVDQLQHELLAVREYLSSTIAQHAATTEELGMLNEELQSTNEELQSSNEELQTAKEELQSTNDELEIVNTELEKSNVGLGKLTDDLINVLANVDVAIVIVDAERNVRRFTPKARALFKLIDSDVGRPIADLQPSAEIPDLGALIGNVIETLVAQDREIRDAAGRAYRLHVRPYRTSDQRISGAVLSFVDITLLRQSIEANERADQAERAARTAAAREKDAFLDAVSHELRTPLSAILLWTAVIRQSSIDPQVKRAVETIETCTRGEAQLVDDLLDLAMSRTNSSALSIAVQTIEPCPIVEAAVDSLRSSAEDKHITVTLDLDRRANVRADPRRLRQIAWHLVANAIKFTPRSGLVRVRVGRHDGVIELVVSDTGKGINSEFLATVFEPFTQEDLSSTREYAGLGIGLAFVRHLVERQAGSISVHSDGEGAGATFTVRLPAA